MNYFEFLIIFAHVAPILGIVGMLALVCLMALESHEKTGKGREQ